MSEGTGKKPNEMKFVGIAFAVAAAALFFTTVIFYRKQNERSPLRQHFEQENFTSHRRESNKSNKSS